MAIERKVVIHFILYLSLFVIGSCSSGGNGTVPATVTCGEVSGTPVEISGVVLYEDKEYDQNGFTGKPDFFKAIRFAKVQVIDSIDNTVLEETVTNRSGAYSVQFTPKCLFVYLKVIASTSFADSPEVEVRKTGNGALHYFRGTDIDLDGFSTIEYDISVLSDSNNAVSSVLSDNSTAGSFNILDVMTSGGEFVRSFAGEVPPLLKIYWEKGKQTPGGTSYYCTALGTFCPQGEGIYILGGDDIDDTDGEDTDDYDDDVLLHEYGHFTAAKKSRDDSPGGIHFLTDNNLDLRLAWSEGWGNFFHTAVKVWLNENYPEYLSIPQGVDFSLYVDTLPSVFWFNIAQLSKEMIYSGNEVAVANVLWKIMNGSSDGMQDIWDVFSNYIPNVITPTNMEAFWDGWLALKAPTESEKFYFFDRQINYFKDNFEPDSDISSAISHEINRSKEHTFYRNDLAANDIDYISFDVIAGQNYTVQTSNLVNGADTYIKILQSDGTLIASNDNLEGSGSLKSKASFNSSISGTLYVEVSISSEKPDSSGDYGSYTISITTP